MVHQGTSVIDGVTYQYDSNENRTQRTDLRTNIVERYVYDSTHQLKQEWETKPGTAEAIKERFLYDAVGNRLGAAHATNTYDAANRLLSASNESYTYDSNGNLASESGTSTGTYTWNPLNQLVSATVGENTVNFAYDYLGRRILNGTTMYLYDGVDISEEVNATTGATSRRFVQGTGSDEHLAIHKGGLWYFYEQDGLGSVTSLTDTTGAVVAGYTYSSFGKSTEDTGTFSQPYRFTGREWDGNIHLYYYRARYYDPTIGRFISEDPARFAGSGPNFYQYASNRPICVTDPFGLSSLVYNGSTHTITLYSGNNFDGAILAQGVAYNNVITSAAPFPYGTYQAVSWHTWNAGSEDSSFGLYGNLVFDVPGRSGMSVHSGRASTGPQAKTEGCIRTTDSFMKAMYDTVFLYTNPVTQLMNVDILNPPAGANPRPLFWAPGAGNPPAQSKP